MTDAPVLRLEDLSPDGLRLAALTVATIGQTKRVDWRFWDFAARAITAELCCRSGKPETAPHWPALHPREIQAASEKISDIVGKGALSRTGIYPTEDLEAARTPEWAEVEAFLAGLQANLPRACEVN